MEKVCGNNPEERSRVQVHGTGSDTGAAEKAEADSGEVLQVVDEYPTRKGKSKDTVWWVDRTGDLFGPNFLRRGFSNLFRLPKVETDDLTDESERIKLGRRGYFNYEADNLTVRSVFGVHLLSDPIRRLSESLGIRARRILGGDVFVSQSRINYKTSMSGSGWGWHSDFETWHEVDGMPQMKCVSFMVCLTDNEVTNGPLMVIPGSHKYYVSCKGKTPDNHDDALYDQKVGVPDSESVRTVLEHTTPIEVLTGPAGSVFGFDCNILHGSTENMSPNPRTNLFIVFSTIDNRFGKPFSGLEPRAEELAHRRNIV